MFENCRTFLPREIELLEPDILITQGKYGRLAVDGKFEVLRNEAHPEVSEYVCQLLDIRGRTVLKFSTVHPRAVKFFDRERELAYPWYIQQAQEFLLHDPNSST
jgi:uracil-DNA glycosylase